MHGQRITDPAFQARFWSRVQVSDGCWLWTGAPSKKGYGNVWCEGKLWRAHRVAWTITHGPIPDGLFCCHACDRPACCRVDHLWLGTTTDNMRDMSAKGRRVVASPKGERHPFARLTDDLVRTIRQRRNEGWTYTRLAADFGINRAQAYRIVTHQRWAHIT